MLLVSLVAPQCRRPQFNSWVAKIPRRRAWQPIPVFLPGESPWTEEPGRLQSMESQRIRYDWATTRAQHNTCFRPHSAENILEIEDCALNSISGECCYLNHEMIITKTLPFIHQRGNKRLYGIYQHIKWWQTTHSVVPESGSSSQAINLKRWTVSARKMRQPLSFLGLPIYFKFKIFFYTFTKALGQRFDIFSPPSPRFIMSINHCCSSNRVPASVILSESALLSIIYFL